MKKRLLTVALAAVFGMGAYAYNVGDYLLTKDARLKVSGENIATNTQDMWTNEIGGPIAANWKAENAQGPDGSEILTILSNDAVAVTTENPGTALYASWQLQPGLYAISFWVYSPEAGTTSVTAGGNNYMSFNCGESKRQINATANLGEAAWTQITDTVFVNTADAEILEFTASSVKAGIRIANVEVVAVEEVYDVRIMQKEISYIERLLDDPNFNTEEAASTRSNVQRVINSINSSIDSGNLDDAERAASFANQLQSRLAAYMNVTTEDLTLNTYFNYIEDLEDMGQYNRGKIADGQQIGGFKFYGANWQHGVYRGANNVIIEGPNGKKGLPYIQKAIQAGQNGPGPGSVALVNSTLPAGKYFVSAEMMNAFQDGKYVPSYTLEANVKGFVGTDTVDLGTIVGEEYTRLYFVAELKEGESLEAGFWWEGTTQGGLWNLTNFQIRTFNLDAAAAAAHKDAWTKFKAQWDAMVNGRKNAESIVGDANYPWSQQILTDSLTKWNPIYDAEVAKGWVSEDGSDAGIATTDELLDWVQQQGQDPAGEGYQPYPIVRGFQGAYNKVVAANKIFSDLANDVKAAKTVKDDAMNVNGDKATFQAAIDAAQKAHDDILASTTDATMAADSLTLATARETLAAAVEAFKASAVMTPIIDIDFSSGFEPIEEEGMVVSYVVKGAAGEMVFPADAVNTDNTADVTAFQIGYKDAEALKEVLRVGKGSATVEMPVVPGDEDVIRAAFDAWLGKFVTYGYLAFELRNAADERIAGFSYNRYDNATKFNDFTNFDLSKTHNLGNVNNDAIYFDQNKSSFEIIVDNKAKAVQAILTNTAGKYTSDLTPIASTITDTKVAKVVLSSEYSNAGRRSWFDNLKVYKYVSQADGPIDSGVKAVAGVKADGAIYNLAGQRLNAAPQKGLYIQNGKKFVVK